MEKQQRIIHCAIILRETDYWLLTYTKRRHRSWLIKIKAAQGWDELESSRCWNNKSLVALTCHSAECEQTVKAMPALTHPRYRVKAANVRMQAEKRTSMLTEWNTQPNREGGNVRQSIVILLSSIHDVSPQKKKRYQNLNLSSFSMQFFSVFVLGQHSKLTLLPAEANDQRRCAMWPHACCECNAGKVEQHLRVNFKMKQNAHLLWINKQIGSIWLNK